jgi:inhibitor of KinA sporulation pathway (predicted exonuclease)
VKTQKIDSTFHKYIKPQAYPVLSDFCTKLTGITQEMVDNGPLGGHSFVDVMKQHRKWLIECGLIDDLDQQLVPFAYLTCGDWDLKTALPINCNYFHVAIPRYMKTWINIKTHFAQCTKSNGRGGMAGMLNHLKLELEGKHHSGIADCHNILKIVIHLQNKYNVVWKDPSQENNFQAGDWACPNCNDHNYNRNAACRQCQQKRPVDNTNNTNTNSGGGGGGGESNFTRPAIVPRPGDWVCTCGYNNFARNTHCKSCSTGKYVGEGSTASFAHSSSGGPPPKPGDWRCKCGFNNFARNVSCKKCNGPK